MRYVLLFLAVVATSGSAYFVREAELHPVMLASYRMWLAALFLLPVFLRNLRNHPEVSPRKLFIAVVPPAILLGIELSIWNFAARNTSMANASLVVNLMPLAMPIVLWTIYRERINRREVFATAVAMLGLALLLGGDFAVNPDFLLGDFTALLTMLFLTVYLVLARRFSELPSIWLYVVPMYAVGGVVMGLAGLVVADDYVPSGVAEWWPVLGLALLPTVIGHSTLNWCMQRIRGQIVALVNLMHPLFAGVIGFFAFDETPTGLFYVAAVLLVSAAAIVVFGPKTDMTVEPKQADVYRIPPGGQPVIDLTNAQPADTAVQAGGSHDVEV